MDKFRYAADGTKKECPRTILEALGIRQQVDLPYNSLQELEASLKTMNLLDMHDLAVKMSVKPHNDRQRLTRSLTARYIQLTRTYGSAVKDEENPSKPKFDPKMF